MSGFEYRIPSQFVLSGISAGNAPTCLCVPAVASQTYYLTGFNLDLLAAASVNQIASVIGAPTVNGGLAYAVQGKAGGAPWVNDDLNPPLQMQPGATVGLNLASAAGTWVVNIFGFLGNLNF